MRNVVYYKTEAGKTELAQRGKLTQRLRTLLVMIDGKQPASTFLDSLKGLGVDESSFGELARLGLITAQSSSAAPVPANLLTQGGTLIPNRERLRELHSFFNETIRDALGLRGFTLQLKVEKANSLEDFSALRDSYVSAIRKSKGEIIANAFAARLDALLK